MGTQLLPHRPGRDQHRLCRAVEPANIAPEPGRRQAGALRHIIGEMGVIGSGEGHVAAQAPAAGGKAERPFGRQMDGIGTEGGDRLPHYARTHQCQPDFGIGRTGNGAIEIGRDHLHVMAHMLQFGLDRLQCAHHTIDLRRPGVGDDRDPHAPSPRQAAISAGVFSPRLAISSAQCSTSIAPLACSTSAVQPSTQSPSL